MSAFQFLKFQHSLDFDRSKRELGAPLMVDIVTVVP